MSAIIIRKYDDIKLYNDETTTERIERLLKENDVIYETSSKYIEPSYQTLIIPNNIVFNKNTLLKYLNKSVDLSKIHQEQKYRITDTNYDEYLAIITEDNKDIINKDLRISDLTNQNIIITDDYYSELLNILKKDEPVFIVSSKSMTKNIISKVSQITKKYIIFNNYNPNPTFEDIMLGKELFVDSKANTIIAIGGGSSIDVAKCIKAFTNINSEEDIINKNYKYSDIKLIAIPTTSGTGSESTEVAIMYYKGEKTSVDHPSDLPNYAILDNTLLITLPEYQKKSVMLDALCQSIEAYWSKNRSTLSKRYSKKSIELIIKNYKEYLNNDLNALKNIQIAANLSGKAITLAKTTAPHTMCYRLTTKHNIAHGHAVALTLIHHWKLITELCDDKTKTMLKELSNIIGFDNIEQSIIYIENIINEMNLPNPIITEDDIKYLSDGVDLKRLYNHPIPLTYEDIYNIFSKLITK